MTYLLLIQDEDWVIGSDELVNALQKGWPASKISRPADGDPARDIEWVHGTDTDRVEGAAHTSGQCIYLDGRDEAVAAFVAWYRQLVPAERTVVFCDDTYSFDAIVEPGTDPDGVLALLPE